MKINVIEGYTHVHGAPEGWTREKQGECAALATKLTNVDGVLYHVSEIELEPHEIADLLLTRRLHLWVSSPDQHPVVSLTVAKLKVDAPDEG